MIAKAIPKVLNFAGDTGTPESYRPAAERIIAGDPVQTAVTVFASEDGRFQSGIWTAQPGKWRVVFTESEFCQLLEGSIVVTGDDGSTQTFKAGDAFVSPAGFKGTWEVVEPTRKYYACYERRRCV
ncbi:MAG TPA: cupin domain-containing protein [Stellaceae bacterium]|nr:cupin domain-containing protein [Stellaceae bacterium]